MSTINLKYHTPASHTALRVTLEKMDITWRFAVAWSWSKVSFLDKPVFPWKSSEITMPLATLFGVELRDLANMQQYKELTACAVNRQTIYSTPKTQLEGCSSVASLSWVRLTCRYPQHTHNILLEWWVLVNLSANWWDTLRFLPHIFQTHTHTQKPLDFSECLGHFI